MYRVALVVLFAVGLSACSVSPPAMSNRVSLEELSQEKYRNTNASYEGGIRSPTAFAVLPAESGRVTRVSQKAYPEGLRQQISYDQPVPGLSENGIDLRIQTSNAVALDDSLAIGKPTEASIRSELRSQFPKMAMQVVDHPRSNSYGPYGLAVGRWANGARCIYAWQWIDDVRVNRSAGNLNPASVRIRLCRKDVTLDQLAAYVDGLRIDMSRYDPLEVATNVPERTPVTPDVSRNKIAPRRTVARHTTSHVARIAAPLSVATPATVTVAEIPKSSDGNRDAALDPSLPAAAYRGPVASNAALVTAGK